MDFFKRAEGRVIAILIIVALAVWSVRTGFDAYYSLKSAEQLLSAKSITVTADDKVVGKPDIAELTLSVVSKGKDVGAITTDNNTKMNAIVASLKQMEINEADIKTTAYSLHPEYDYSSDFNRTNEIIGYSLEQTVLVKIRKLSQVGTVVQKATSLGANEVGSPNFTIDNIDQLKSDARAKALTKAKEKAETLAKQAGVRLGSIVSFSDDTNYPRPMYDSYSMKSVSAAEGATPAPSFEVGSTDITANVTITYEIF